MRTIGLVVAMEGLKGINVSVGISRLLSDFVDLSVKSHACLACTFTMHKHNIQFIYSGKTFMLVLFKQQDCLENKP